jgi:hypothetical protein
MLATKSLVCQHLPPLNVPPCPQEKKAAANGGPSELTPEEEEMQRLMGFSGFSSKN